MNKKRIRTSRSGWAALAMVAALGVAPVQANPEVPGAAQTKPIALVGGTIHPVQGAAVENGTLLFAAGKIVAVGRDVSVPADAERIDVTGKHVYPGLIDANSQLGLVELPSVRGSVDVRETGMINPNVKAEVAVNPDSELIPVGRSGGVLTVLSVPSGALIAGQSACIQLDGWTWEEMTLKRGVGLHITWPRMQPVDAWWIEESASQQTQERDRALTAIRQAVADAKAYRQARDAHAAGKAPPIDNDARWEAMLPVLAGDMRVFIEADDIQQIQAALAFCDQEGLRPVIVGGYDAPACEALLKKHDVPVIIGGVYRTPVRRNEAYDAGYTLPARLHAAGIRFCIAGEIGGASSGGAPNLRNLPYHAGSAVAYGLSADEAIKAITLYPAQILGVADRIGTLEADKDATLIVTTGDVLEISTQVTDAYIQGRKVDLNDRQKRLWEKYKEKYRRLGINN